MIVPIIRLSNLQDAVIKYSHLGKIIAEQHETGPRHYSLQNKHFLVEFYPTKNRDLDIDFYIEFKNNIVHMSNNKIYDPDKRFIIINSIHNKHDKKNFLNNLDALLEDIPIQYVTKNIYNEKKQFVDLVRLDLSHELCEIESLECNKTCIGDLNETFLNNCKVLVE